MSKKNLDKKQDGDKDLQFLKKFIKQKDKQNEVLKKLLEGIEQPGKTKTDTNKK
jgi:hypothetical protein